eukprot:UN32378
MKQKALTEFLDKTVYNRKPVCLKRGENIINKLSSDEIEKLPDEIDLVVSGGGFRVGYTIQMLNCLTVLQRQHNKCKVVRSAGASSSTLCLFLFVQGLLAEGVAFVREFP